MAISTLSPPGKRGGVVWCVRKSAFCFLTPQHMCQRIVDLLFRLAYRLSEANGSEPLTCVKTIEKGTTQGASVRIWRRPNGELPAGHIIQLLIPCEDCKAPTEVGSFPSEYLTAMVEVLVGARDGLFFDGVPAWMRNEEE